MIRRNIYTDLDGREVVLSDLDEGERKLVRLLQRRAQQHPDWNDFDFFWTKRVGAFYDARGVPRRRSASSPVTKIAQDLSGRLAIAAGFARLSDYRDELDEIIRTRFKTRRAFCKVAGLSEDMLSHVLSGRKHLAIDTLMEALGRIGYRLRIVPRPRIEPVSKRKYLARPISPPPSHVA